MKSAIKLSELCYKTISSDFVEDKKHIDLSSEPLIIVCAAGSKGTVIGDIIKDTAIFKAPQGRTGDHRRRRRRALRALCRGRFPGSPGKPAVRADSQYLGGTHLGVPRGPGHPRRLPISCTKSEPPSRTPWTIWPSRAWMSTRSFWRKALESKSPAFTWSFVKDAAPKNSPRPITHASDLALLFKYLSGRLPPHRFRSGFRDQGNGQKRARHPVSGVE